MTDSDGTLGNPPQPGTPANFSGANSSSLEQIQVKPIDVLEPIPPNPFTKLDQVSNMGTFTLSKKGKQPTSVQNPQDPVTRTPLTAVRVGTEIAGKPQSQEIKAQQEKIITLREEISSLEARTEDVFKIFLATNVPLVFDDEVQPAGEIKAQILGELAKLRENLQIENPNTEEAGAALASLKEELEDYWSIAERKLKETLAAKPDSTSDIDSIKSITDLQDRANGLLEELANYHQVLTEEEKNRITLELEDIRSFVKNPSSADEVDIKIKLKAVDKILREKKDSSSTPPRPEDSDPAAAQALALEEASRREDLAQFQTKLGRFEEKLSNLKKEKVFINRNTLPRIEEVISKLEDFLRRYPEMGDVSVLKVVIGEQFKNLEELLSKEEQILEQAKGKHSALSKRIIDLGHFISEVPELITKGDQLSVNIKIDSSVRGDIYDLVDKLRWLREPPHKIDRDYDVTELRTQIDALKELITKAEESLLSEEEGERLEKERNEEEKKREQEKKTAEQEEAIETLNELNGLLPSLLSTSNQLEAIIPKIEDTGRRDELIQDNKELHALQEEIKTTKTQKRLEEFKVRLIAHERNVEEESRIIAEKEAALENSLALNVFDGWPSTIRFEVPKHNPKQGQPTPKKAGRWVIAKNGIEKPIDPRDAQLFTSMKTNFDKTFKEYLDFIAEPNSNKKIVVARELIIVKNKIIAALIEEKADEAQRLIRSFSTVLNETIELWKKKVEEEEKSLLESKKRQAEKVALEERMKKREETLAEVEETSKLLEPYLNGEDIDGIVSKKTELKKLMRTLVEMKNTVHEAISSGKKGAEESVSAYENLLGHTKLILGEIESEINETEKRLNKKYNRKTGQFETKEESVIRTPSAQVPADNRTYSFKDKKTGEWKTVDANGWKEEQERRAEEQERISAMTPEQMLAEGIERREEKSGEQAYLDFLERDPKGFKQAFVGKKWSYGDPLKKVVTDVIKKYVDRLRTKQIDMNDRLNKHRAEAERLGEGEGGYNTLAAAGYEKKLELLGNEIDSLDENMIPQAELDKRNVAEQRAKDQEKQSLNSVKQTYQPAEGVTKLAPIPEGFTQEQLRDYKAPEAPLKSDGMVRSIDMNDPNDAWRKTATDLRYVEKQGHRVETVTQPEALEEKKKRKFTAVKNLFESLQKMIKVDPKLPNSEKMRTRRLILGGSLAAVTSAVMLAALLPDDKRSESAPVASAPRTLEEAVPLESWRKFVSGKSAHEELKAVVNDVVDRNIGFEKFAQKYFTEMHIDFNNPESLNTVAKLEPFTLISNAPTYAGLNKDQRKQLCDYIMRLQQIGDATYGLAREKQKNAESMGPKPRETLEEFYMRMLTAAVNADSRYQIALAQRTTRT